MPCCGSGILSEVQAHKQRFDSWCRTNHWKHKPRVNRDVDNNTNNNNRNVGIIFADCRRVAGTPDHDASHHAPLSLTSSQLFWIWVWGRGSNVWRCAQAGAVTRWSQTACSRRRCRSGSCCVLCVCVCCCFGPRPLPLFLLPLPRLICQGRSVYGWRVDWREEREKLWLGSCVCVRGTKETNVGLSNCDEGWWDLTDSIFSIFFTLRCNRNHMQITLPQPERSGLKRHIVKYLLVKLCKQHTNTAVTMSK